MDRPNRSQTIGKIERFRRTRLCDRQEATIARVADLSGGQTYPVTA